MENEMEELNEENDAREEDIVEDTDADEKDTRNDFDDVMKKLNSIYDEIAGIKNGMKALENAQAMLVENGAVITDEGEELPNDNISRRNVTYDDIDFSF